MYYKTIFLNGFRNLNNSQLEFNPNVNIFVGNNGQGKTNLVESIFLISQGESFRYGDNSVLIGNGHKEAIIKSKAIDNKLIYDFTVQIQKSKKNLFFSQKKISWSEISSRFPIILFSPESLSIIKEADDQRRGLIDQLLSTIDQKFERLIQNYKKVLKTRNKVLKDHSEGLKDFRQTMDLLESLNPNFLEYAAQLTFERTQAIRKIEPYLNNAMRIIQSDRNVDILVEYVVSGVNVRDFSQENIKFLIEKRANELNKAELSFGSSLVGPHKHDVKFLYNGNDSRFYCSQGQQRALILSYKMAQIVYHRELHGSEPVLVLDDVLSELDIQKRTALLCFLQEIKSQIFITTTDLQIPFEIKKNETSIFEISNGKIETTN